MKPPLARLCYIIFMIEIEKKFLLTEAQRARLLKDAKKLEDKKVEDSYFDTSDYRLTTKDYWLRLRNVHTN